MVYQRLVVMNVLMISPQVPYPLVGGAKIVTYNTIKYLSQLGINLTLLSIADNCSKNIPELEKYCRVSLVPVKTSNSKLGIIRSFFSSIPYTISKYISRAVLTELDRLILSNRFDLVHIEHLHMAYCGQYVASKYSLPVLLRFHNVESVILRRYLNFEKDPFRQLFIRFQYERLYNYEKKIIKYFDKCIMISERDKEIVEIINPQVKVTAINPGMDIISSKRQPVQPHEILFVGTMDWLPNEDAMLWFTNLVFPLIQQEIKDIKLVLVGSNPSFKIRSLSSGTTITVQGKVRDVRPYHERASVFIVPLRSGSGIRIKIIEALLMKVPVVSTTIGAEGMGLKNEKHIRIADDEVSFAQAVVSFLSEPGYAKRVSQRGYVFARENYDPYRKAEQFVREYHDMVSDKAFYSCKDGSV